MEEEEDEEVEEKAPKDEAEIQVVAFPLGPGCFRFLMLFLFRVLFFPLNSALHV